MFLKIFGMTLVIVEISLFLGVYRLFDFSRSYYGAGAACAFIIAFIIYGFVVQSEKIEALEERLAILEQNLNT